MEKTEGLEIREVRRKQTQLLYPILPELQKLKFLKHLDPIKYLSGTFSLSAEVFDIEVFSNIILEHEDTIRAAKYCPLAKQSCHSACICANSPDFGIFTKSVYNSEISKYDLIKFISFNWDLCSASFATIYREVEVIS